MSPSKNAKELCGHKHISLFFGQKSKTFQPLSRRLCDSWPFYVVFFSLLTDWGHRERTETDPRLQVTPNTSGRTESTLFNTTTDKSWNTAPYEGNKLIKSRQRLLLFMRKNCYSKISSSGVEAFCWGFIFFEWRSDKRVLNSSWRAISHSRALTLRSS